MRKEEIRKDCYNDPRVYPARLGNCRNVQNSMDLMLAQGREHICKGDIVEGMHGFRIASADVSEVASAHGKITFKKNCVILVNGRRIPAMRKKNPKGEWASFYVGKVGSAIQNFIIPPGKNKSFLTRYDRVEWEDVSVED